MMRLVFAFSAMATSNVYGVEMHEATSVRSTANPIRKVVTMLETMKKKVEAEGEKELELYEKYMCYCKTSGGDLEKSIAGGDSKVPEVTAAITAGTEQKAQLDADLVKHKDDRAAAEKALSEAAAIREKEAAAFASTKAEYGANVAAIEKAVAALEKGMAGAFVQTKSAQVLRNAVQTSANMLDGDRQEVMAFLMATEGATYAPASGEITGILKQLGDEMAKGLSEATAVEEEAISNYEGLTAAKKKEIAAATSAIEEKSTRTGELAVEIAEMKNDLSDTEAALAADKEFLADLKKNCDTKSSEWDEIVKVRSEEIVALTETIKVLNDDDALELFKKTLPGSAASFVQVKVDAASARARALTMIRKAQQMGKPGRQHLDFIALALHGKKVGFEKVIGMIDEMVEVLKKEQADDDSKKAYCATEFDTTEDTKKGLELSIQDSETAIAAAEETIASLVSDISALEDAIKELDKEVTKATELRQSEHEDFTELMAQDSAAKDLLAFAKNRLNKFYNPKLYLPPPKRELSEEERLVVNFGGTVAPTPAPGGIAGTGVTVLAQVSAHVQVKDAPPPPPESFGAYKKKAGETSGVIAMIDMLVKDLTTEMTVAEQTEKDAQADYEEMMSVSAEKRAADAKLLDEKTSAKAETEATLQTHKEEKVSSSKELASTLETIQALHTECDWLMQHFETRKEARASEIESLGNAKSVLSGADFSLLQTRNLRGRM